jgi:aminoglycoside 2'-N-acetyltransferase I
MPELRLAPTAALGEPLLREIRALLDAAFGERFSDDDWAHGLGGWHAVLSERGVVVAHASVVPRVLEVAGRPFRTGYVEAVGTRPDRQGQGLGTQVSQEVTSLVRDRYELGALSTGAHHFYARLGWERWRGPTYVRHGEDLVRTEDEDDGVMVLRTGPSAGLDLAAAISCETRPGDDW